MQGLKKCLPLPSNYGPVVQLNRTSDSGSEGRGFESRRGHCLLWCFPPLIVLCKRSIGRKRDGADRGC